LEPLAFNSIVEWTDTSSAARRERLLYLAPGDDTLVVIALPKDIDSDGDSESLLPTFQSYRQYQEWIVTGRIVRLLDDEWLDSQAAESLLPAKHRKRRDLNWELIAPLVDQTPDIFVRQQRGKMIRDRAKETKRGREAIYKYLIRFWQGGQVPNAVLPLYTLTEETVGGNEVEEPGKKRGPKSSNGQSQGIAIGPKERAKIRYGLKKYYYKKDLSVPEAYSKTIADLWSVKVSSCITVKPLPPEERPTYRQFCFVHQKEMKREPAKHKRARHGDRRFQLRSRPLTGCQNRASFGPGSFYEIDAGFADVELVNEVSRLPIGRPTIYLVPDFFCLALTGLAITLEQPSCVGAFLALENSFSNKVNFCRSFDIQISEDDWPCHHVPKALKADRGELIYPKADVLVNAFGIRLDNLPAYRPDMKGLVERFFKRLNEKLIHGLPGAIKNKRERGDPDPKLGAVLDLRQFTQLAIRVVLELNSEWMDNYHPDADMISDDVALIPIELWKWGVANRSGILRTRSQATIRTNLLPRDAATVTRSGIVYKGLCYEPPKDLAERWQVRASDGYWEVDISYDPRLVDRIQVCQRRPATLLPCDLCSNFSAFLGWSFREVAIYQRSRSEKKRASRERQLQKQIENDAQNDELLTEATEMTAAAISTSTTKSARRRHVKENRSAALRQERRANGWIEPGALPLVNQSEFDAGSGNSAAQIQVPTNVIPMQTLETGCVDAATSATRLRKLRDQNQH
jgi:putative transposase